MKVSVKQVHRHKVSLPAIKFQDQTLTSFGGLVVYLALFQKLRLAHRLAQCFRHLACSTVYKFPNIILVLIVHLLLGFRQLRDTTYYKDDPMVLRTVGFKTMPSVPTLSRILCKMDAESYNQLRLLSKQLVLERLADLMPMRLTVDFDGSVLWTKSRNTEGTAVGYNVKKKGARSYYPLFATVAQTGQVYDSHHRPGNVHDSNGADDFVKQTFGDLHAQFPQAILEARLDSAHFNDATCSWLDDHTIEFSISVPFERFPELKRLIENRRRWRSINATWSFFECDWKPKKWKDTMRFVFYRQKVLKQRKGPLQLDLFIPQETDFEFKVVVTNKSLNAKKLLAFHNGRGSQEGIFGELKSQMQMDYIPTRRLLGNQIYTLSAVMAHNLTRELQMIAYPMNRGTSEKRSPKWIFQEIRTLRHRILQRAGRLTKPQGFLTLIMSANDVVKKQIRHLLAALGYRI